MGNSGSGGDNGRKSSTAIYMAEVKSKTSLLGDFSNEKDLASEIEYHSQEVFLAICEYQPYDLYLDASSDLDFLVKQAKKCERKDLGYFISRLETELVDCLDDEERDSLMDSYFEKLYFYDIKLKEIPPEYRVKKKRVSNRGLIRFAGESLSQRIEKEINDSSESEIEPSYLEKLEDLQLRLESNLKMIRNYHNEFVKSNLRLVMNKAKHFVDHGLDYLDLIQEGNLGLIKAVDKFDYRKGIKFSTYAIYWIKQSITRALAEDGKTIKVPVYVAETLHSHYVNSIKLMHQLGREPTQDEVLPITARQVVLRKIKEGFRNKGIERGPTEEEIAKNIPDRMKKLKVCLKAYQDTFSLEESIEFGGEYVPFSAFIQDKKATDPADFNYTVRLREGLRRVLATLTAREEKILRMKFGFGELEADGWKEMGHPFRITGERARQLSGKALEKLRQPSKRETLEKFVGDAFPGEDN